MVALGPPRKNSNRRRKFCGISVVGLVVVWVLYLLLVSQKFKTYSHHQDTGGGLVDVMFGSATNDDGNVETFSRVIFIISMGKEASASKMVERFVWSARYRGEWRGYIVLLTDAPKSRYEGLSHHFIVMNPQPNHFNGSFPLDMPYKRFKTHLLEYVGMDPRLNPAKLVYYLDVDNIVGNSLPRMFEGLEAKYNIPGTPWIRTIPRIWFFQNKYKHLSVQGGQFILDRATSQPCLSYWRDLIDGNITESKDQPALHRIRNDRWNTRCQIITMRLESYLYFPTEQTMERDNELVSIGTDLEYPTLIHIKNSCNLTAHYEKDIEERYIQRIIHNTELSKKIHIAPDNS